MKNQSQIDCEAVRAVLPLFVGGEWESDSSQASHAQIQAHVQACPACSQEWRQGVALVRLRQAAWQREAQDAARSAHGASDLRARVMGAIASESIPSIAEARTRRTGGTDQPRRWAPMAAAAALVLAAVGLSAQYWSGGKAQDVAPVMGSPAAPSVADQQGPAAQPVRVAEGASGLRRLEPTDKSVLEEARPWGLEETPAVNVEFRQGAMKMARGR